MKFHSIYVSLIFILLFSCKKEDETAQPISLSLEGIFIVNEGQFGLANGSISYYNRGSGNLIADIYKQQNGNNILGDVVSSMKLHNGKGYIVVNNSQKVEVVSINNFKSIGTINNLISPRYFYPLNNQKAYVTDWVSNVVTVIDLNQNQIIKTIPVGAGPEQMIVANEKLYVTNVGGFSSDSSITIIDTNSDTVLKTIVVGRNPNSIVKDKNNMIWILCNGDIGPDFTGGTSDDIAGELIKLNPANDSIVSRFTMGASDHPMKLTIDVSGEKLYYLNGISGFNGKIHYFNINNNSLPIQPLINKTFYGFGKDPVSNNILGALAPDFSQKGYMFRYTETGILIDSLQVGVAPNGFAFN